MDTIKENFLYGIDKDIRDILFPYLKVVSTTFSPGERLVNDFFMNLCAGIDYFKNFPENYGVYSIENDPLDRGVCWALVKGVGDDTVVFIHHYDVVGTEDFKMLTPLAYDPTMLSEELFHIKASLPTEARTDLESGDYMFGRGSCDMKGGGAIQLALIKKYSQMKDIKGNVLIIAVPDEENLSYGMRGAVKLLHGLKKERGLNYCLMINSEPHQRVQPETGIFSEGSVGKTMPFAYVRGYLAHAGKVFEGFNPANLLSRIVAATEFNKDFCDVVGNEVSPPPTCLYLKDGKSHYDVSMPLSAFACISVLSFDKTPEQILGIFRDICRDSFEAMITDMNQSLKWFRENMGETFTPLPWKANVTCFNELYAEAAVKGEVFTTTYQAKLKSVTEMIRAGELNMVDATRELVELVYGYIDDISPRVVIGLAPPYYPCVSNIRLKNLSPAAAGLSKRLAEYARQNFGQEYVVENFFKGISDLSYTGAEKSGETMETLKNAMPLFGRAYDIPMDQIEEISMPCINVGPWGKDFHKLTERVYTPDLFDRTPRLVHEAVKIMLGWE